jgi:cell division protein FtsN
MCATKAQPAAADLTRPDTGDGDATTALYRAAIGPVNTAYYLPIFQRFEAADRVGPSWNWAAAMCTLNWMAYRRLWSGALMYSGTVVGLALMIFGIGRLVFQFSEFTELALIFGFVVLAIALPGLFGNALFHTHARKRMAHALAVNANFDEACAMLTRHSSSRLRLITLCVANAAALGIAVSGYFFAPQGGMLPHSPAPLPADTRNAATGKAIEPAAPASAPAPSPAVAASDPIAAASSPALAASSPARVASQPVEEIISPAPQAAASAPEPVVAAAPVKTESAPKPKMPPPKFAVVKPPKKVVPSIKPDKVSKAAKTAKAAVAQESVTQERFYLNVGLFADDNNARNAHVKLMDAGLPSAQQEMNTSNGKRTRVRVGPFETLTEADRAAKKIRDLGLEAALVRP